MAGSRNRILMRESGSNDSEKILRSNGNILYIFQGKYVRKREQRVAPLYNTVKVSKIFNKYNFNVRNYVFFNLCICLLIVRYTHSLPLNHLLFYLCC